MVNKDRDWKDAEGRRLNRKGAAVAAATTRCEDGANGGRVADDGTVGDMDGPIHVRSHVDSHLS